MKGNDTAVASREFKVALLLNPVNKAEAHTDLAESYFSLGGRTRRRSRPGRARACADLRPRARPVAEDRGGQAVTAGGVPIDAA